MENFLILLSCRRAARAVGEGRAGAAAWLHLALCRHCRRYRRQLRLIAAAARELARGALDPAKLEALERRLIERLV